MQGGEAKSIFTKPINNNNNLGGNTHQKQQYMAPMQEHHHATKSKEVMIMHEHGIDAGIKSPDGQELSRVDSPPMTERSNFMGAGP